MKKLLNPKLAEKKVTVIEDSSSQEKLGDSEEDNKEVMKGKKTIVSKEKPVFTDAKILDIFMEVQNKMIQEQQQNDIKSSCMEKKEVIEEVQCNVEAEKHPKKPVTFTDLMKEDEEIYKKLKIPWAPEGMLPISESKSIDSEKENMQRSINQYKHQIEYMHETNDGLVTANRRLREDLEEVNSHYQELIAVSREALKRKRQTENQFTELKQTI